MSHRTCQWTNDFGHGKINLKADQEATTADLQRTAREERIKAMDEVAKNI